MGKYFMPSRETAEEFQEEAEKRGTMSRIESDETGGYNVITDDDDGGADKGDFVDTISESAHEYAPARREAVRDAVDDWDDALPDESPIGKSQSELDELERREQKRLGRDKKYKEPRERPDVAGGVKSAMKLMGVGKVNKSALSLYGVGGKSERKPGRTDLYSGENLGMRELTTPRSFGNKSMRPMTMPQSKPRVPQGISPIAAMSTQSRQLSPLNVASLNGHADFGVSPLAQESTKLKLRTSKIGIVSTAGLTVNPAATDMSKIARMAKQSSIIAPISKFSFKINNLRRGK